MPASSPTSVNQNLYNTMTGHSYRCGVIEITEKLFGTVVFVIKIE